MNESNSSTNETTAAQTPATWPRPTLVALPALRDLTLQSGVAAAAGTAGGFGFVEP